MIKRISGVILVVMAVLVAAQTIGEPLYHVSEESGGLQPYDLGYPEPVDATHHRVGSDFRSHPQERPRRRRWQQDDHPGVYNRQHPVLRLPLHGNSFLLELVQHAHSRIQCSGSRPAQPRLVAHRCHPATACRFNGNLPTTAGQRRLEPRLSEYVDLGLEVWLLESSKIHEVAVFRQ